MSSLLQMIGISIDNLPPFRFSWRDPNLRVDQKEINNCIREDIYRAYIQHTWISPPRPLSQKLYHYASIFLQVCDGDILLPEIKD